MKARGLSLYTYSAYNLGISSELLLPEYVPAGSGGDVVVRLSHTIDTDQGEIRINDQEAVICVVNVARFVVRDGKEITVFPHVNGDSELIRRFIVGTILGLALYQRGYLVMHASSVEVNGEAIAFVGNAGMGKSTMALAMVSKGHKFITDDVCVLDNKNGEYLISPSYPLARISQEAADNFLQVSNSPRFITKFEDKLEYQLGDVVVNGPIPIKRIYMLGNQGNGILQQIDPQKAVLEILKNTLPTRFGHPGDKAHFLNCVELAQTVPMFNLSRANSLVNLSETARLVEEHLLNT